MEQTFTKIIDLLYLAKQQEVEIVLNDGRLQMKVAEDRNVSENLLNQIRVNKQSIIDFLSSDSWKLNKADEKPLVPIQPENRPERIPLSYSQERLWFIHQMEGSVQYHITAVLRLQGVLNEEALAAALTEVMNRHEILRTVYVEEGGRAWQYVKPAGNQLLHRIATWNRDDKDGLKKYIAARAATPFDLSKDSMLRAELIPLSASEHVLLVTMHHIASDAWSMPVLVTEVAELYSAYSTGRAPRLPVISVQYADYALWQRSARQDALLQNKLAYWKQKLDGVLPLELPADNSRPLVSSTRGTSAAMSFPPALHARLQSFCQRQGVTLYMMLLAVFKVLLHRYSGQQDICVGTSIAGRPQKELEGLIGFFVNTLALRNSVDGNMPFTGLLSQVRSTMIEAYNHQQVPFEKVVEAVVKDRDPGRNPLFQVMLVLRNTPEVPELRLGDLRLSGEPNAQTTVKFDLTFFITETPNSLSGSVQYSTDLYRPERIERMIAHFQQLLVSVIEQPTQLVGLLPMLSGQEQTQLLQQFNDNHIAYSTDRTVVSLFEEQVANNPAATALVFEGELLTYQQLNERSNQLAHYLISRGVTPDTLVPLFMERSAGMMVAMLGILKAGAAYVPIDTDFPADRVRYMLEDAGATLIVSSPIVSHQLEFQAGIEIITLEAATISNQPTANPKITLQPHHLAYVIYTSGSTGRPKGVMVEHRHLVDYYYGLKKYIQIDECRSFALVSTIATDLGNTVIYGALLSGGALHIFSKESVNNIEHLHRYFREKTIDCVKIVPSHWKALHNGDTLLLPSKLLVFGGETLPSEVVNEIQASNAGCCIVNHYGPTETTIGKLLHQVQPGKTYQQTIPIGKPFSNTKVYVLSKEMQLCPVGVPGQLYISGDGVARGYYHNETLTNEKFIADPFKTGENSPAIMYRTGDLVQWLADGNITFIGRVDDQVKIRGYRVEPGEVERVLQQTEGVRAAVVIPQQDKQGNNRLTAYIVPQGAFDKEEITSHLKEKLPEYMIPAAILEIDEIPLTANGKVDRKALPNPDEAATVTDRFVAPRNDTEQKMAAIWADVLEEDTIGVHNDFFELGGHSLLAVRLVSAIRKAFTVEIPIGHIFDYPTIAQLSEQLFTQADTTMLPVIEPVNPKPEHIPLSFSQERLWFIHQMEGSVQYHVPAVLRLTGKINTAALQFALQNIVNRHEVLRTVYRQVNGKPYQSIQEATGWQLTVVDGTQFKNDPVALQKQVAQLITAPYNLSEDYILRATLIHLHDEEKVLVITLHHIASDGWSKSVLVNDFVAFYLAFEEDEPARLPQLTIQYADYAIWQRNFLEGPVLETKIDYWKQQLQDVPALQLPTDYARPAIQSNRGAFKSFSIDKEILTHLQRLSQQQNATLFMTLLAAFEVLLYRYSGQTDFSVGTPVAGRNQQETEGLIGFFVNTLALRAKINTKATFQELLHSVREDTLAAFKHQEAPFEKVVEAVVKNRDLSRSPLFQVMFVLRNQPEIPRLDMKDVTVSGAGFEHTTSLFDMTMFVTEFEHGLEGSLEYNTDLFSAATISRLLSHFTQLLASVVATPQQNVSLLPMLSQAEKQQLLVTFNPAAQESVVDKSMIALFEEQVQQTPQATSLCLDEEQLTYEALNAKANQLATYLRTKGVAAGTLVPVCVSRSMDMVVSVLAILKAGAAYVPVDPDYPLQRISYMLQDTQASVLITTDEYIDKLSPAANAAIVNLTTDAATIAGQSLANLPLYREAEGLAYVLYTSGSTGRPKGVCMPDRALTNLLHWQKEQFADTERRVLQFASLNFDVSFQEIFSTLCFGSRLYLIDADRRKDMATLAEYIARHRISHLFLPYIVLKSLAEYLVLHFTAEFPVTEILVAGEQLNITSEINAFINQYQIKLINQYGPTEAHVVSSYTIEPDTEMPALPPIGKPVDNTSLYILDNNQQLVSVGVAGELCIGGQQVAQGYLNLPELTAERFVADTFSVQPGKLMYKTGDLARWLPDGNIAYLGRADEQVKVRGYRIELGEVEAALQQSGLVTAATVIVRKNNDTGSNLVAYVIPKNTFDKEALITHLKTVLPDYMVPALWVPMEVFPLTGSGKIDKQALPEADGTMAVPVYTAPRTRLENELVIIWKELLHLQQVGIYNNFFELGGHSLLAMRLAAAIRKNLDTEVSIRAIFQYNTIADLAKHIETTSRQSRFPAIEVLPRPAFIPLSFSQERLWFIDKLEGSVQYHLPIILRLQGSLNEAALTHALQTIVNRHEVLRTVIREQEAQGYQHILEQHPATVTYVDSSTYAQDKEGLLKQVAELIKVPFDLSAGPMLRVHLITLATDKHILVVTTHHIVSDGWSMPVMIREFVALYNAFTENRPFQLTPLPVQYADYAIWQRNYLQGEVWENEIGYWKEKLEGVLPLNLPVDYSRTVIQSTRGAVVHVKLDTILSDRLQEFSQHHGATLYMTMLAAFNVLLYRYSGQDDICIGTPIANRTQKETEDLIGYFVNTLALRSQLSNKDSFISLLQQVKDTTLEAYEHQEVPFEKVVEAVVKERNISRNPLFQVMFVLQNNTELPEVRLGNMQLSKLGTVHTTSKFDMTFLVAETKNELQLTIEYCTDLYNAATVERMASHYQNLLASIIATPEQTISLLPMVSEPEQQQLLVDFNNTEADNLVEKTIVALFEEQVTKTPDAIAIVFGQQQLTYRQLNERANKTSHYLHSKGVSAETLVPICMERGIGIVTAMLGILKAGGAYVPIDPAYPADRISFMLEDTGATLLLTGEKISKKLPSIAGIEIVDAEALWADNKLGSTNIQTTVAPHQLAYIIYTSGSTGKPKGVMIEHRSLANLVNWHTQVYQVQSASRATAMAGVGFDAFGWEVWPYLSCGASLYIIDDDIRLNQPRLVNLLIDNKITHSFIATALVEDFVKESVNRPTSLVYLLTGGDKLPSINTEDLSYKLVNNYGPTESTVVATSYEVNNPDGNRLPPIGKPIGNTAVYITGSQGELVPVGVSGELCVGGIQVARGYLNLPELTAERFVQNPYSTEPGATLYKTGDLACWLPDGNIAYLGRKDEQVKIRGYRVEPAEIETVIQQSGLVSQAVVITRQDDKGTSTLVAYAVAAEQPFDRDAIITYLQTKLPDYMVPQLWVTLPQLPLTANGKLDRRALPDAGNTTGTNYAAARNAMEAALVSIWQELLRLQTIGIHDNFFEQGGHSLLAMRMVAAVRKKIGVEMAIKDLFQHPTIAALAVHLSTQKQGLLLPAIEALPRPQRIPLSFSQERLWFIHQLGGSLEYHIPAVLRLHGLLDVAALSGALQQIVQRHEVLRTVIREEQGAGCQYIKTAEDWQLIVVTDSIKYKDDPTGLQQYIQKIIAAPFDLSEDYMLRATLLPVAHQEHILVATLHHIASDGWSSSILISELAELYNAYTQQREALLPELAVQYADYALWQRQHLQGQNRNEKLSYWKDKLQGVAVLQLPTDYNRPAVQSTSGGSVGIRIGKNLSDQLQVFSQDQGTTLFMTLLAALNVLLYRYSGQQDICVGTPIAGRQQQELEGLIGFFVNTLALRTKIGGGNTSFAELLQQVRTTTLEAYEHQDVPFERVVELATADRDLSRSPLFQVMLALQNMPETGQLRLGQLKISREAGAAVAHSTTKYDLTMFVTETPHGLSIALEYATALFEQATAKRMLGHFEALLSAITAHPNQNISKLGILSEAERQQLVTTFNGKVSSFFEFRSIVSVFEEQVLKYPEHNALRFKNEALTYKQLNQCANQLAYYLKNKGLKKGAMVPLFMERSKELIIGIIAVLKAGGIYVPIDPEYPKERVDFVLVDIAAHIALTTTKTRQKLHITDTIEIFEIDKILSVSDAVPIENPNEVILPESGANIIYTSGSTGKPKGVVVTQKNVVSLVMEVDYVDLTSNDVLLSTGSPSFDATTFEYWSMLLNGGSLVLCDEKTLLDVQLLKEEIDTRKVNLMWFTSSWFNQLVETDIELFENIKTVLVGGEKLSEYHIGKLKQAYPDIKLLNGYGPTENTTFSTTYPIREREINNSIPIGRPLNNRGVLILDENEGLVPVGVAGEICVSGAGVTKGYLNQPALTAEKFVDHPFNTIQGGKIYKTGDLGSWLPDGNIRYLGRKDEQVKIRGYRIEPGEIESVLQQSDMVKKAVVVAKSNREGFKNIIGYVIITELYTKQKLINWLQARLPSYMVPLIWVEMNSFPLTPNGKINKDALPDADISQLTDNEQQEPRNEFEAKLAAIWQELLGTQKVSIHGNFFEMGGDSILTLQVVNRAKRAGYDLHPRDMFAHQTIARLSGVITSRLSQTTAGEQGALSGECGLLPIQQWYLEKSGVSASHFNQAVLLGIDKIISATELNAILEKLITHHDALRFKYHQENGVWHQEYSNYLSTLVVEDLRTVKSDSLGKLVTEKANIYQRSLNIESGELIRMVWMQMPNGDKQNRLLIIVHHLAVDGVSWRILIENIEFLLTGLLKKQDIDLGVKSSSYRQWYHALEQYGQRQSVLSKIDYWQTVLDSYQPLILNRKPEKSISPKKVSSIRLILEPEKTAQLLQEVPKTYQTEINDILLCALAITLCNICKISNVIIGLEGHGREEIDKSIDTSRTVGWFTSLYPVLIKMTTGQDTGEIIKSVKEQLRLVPDKGLGFGVLKYINKEKKLEENPRWNIVFNYLGQLDNVVQQGKWFKGVKESAGQSISDDYSVDEGLSINGSVQGGQLVLSWGYNSGNFDDETINDLVKVYRENLELLITHCVENFKSGGEVSSSNNSMLPVTSFYNISERSLPEMDTKYLVPIKTTGNKVPLYIVAGGGGTAHKFIKFAKMMSPDQPVYVLQAPDDLKHLKEFPDTIEKIAAVFLEEIIAANPQGPYAISGHCTGGLIAYEMAKQLKAVNRKIHMLAVFDTVVSKKVKPAPASLKNLYYIPIYANRLVSKTLLKIDFEMFLFRKYTKRAIGYKVDSLKKLIRKYRKQNQAMPLEFTGMDLYSRTSNIYVSAHRKYEVAPYDGDLVIFYAKERYYFTDAVNNIRYKKVFLVDKKKNMWQEYVNTIKIYDVEGDHSEMFATTWGDDFARTLQKHLDDAE